MTETTLTLNEYEAMLVASALEGLATQLATVATDMIHGPQQNAACYAVGTLHRIKRRLQGSTPPVEPIEAHEQTGTETVPRDLGGSAAREG